MFTTHQWQPGDAAVTREVLALFATVFPPDVTGEAWFHWKHCESPYGPSIVLYAVDDDTGRIVAARAFWRHRLRVDGDEVLAMQPCDTATHPAYQRRGLFTQLTHAALAMSREAGATVVFNFPNGNSKPGYLKLGWHDVGGMGAFAAVQHYPQVLWHLLETRGHIGPRTAAAIEAPAAYRLTIEQIQAYADTVPDGALYPVKTPAYRAWRYLQHPVFTYYGIPCGEGLAVVRLAARGRLREGIVTEVLAPAGARPDLRAMCRTLARDLRCDLVTTLCTGAHPLAAWAGAQGFRTVATQANFVVRPLVDEGPYLQGPWAIAPVDLDTM